MTLTPDFYGWLGNILFMAGSVLIATKRPSGFIVCLGGNVCYITMGGLTGLTSILIMNSAMLLLNSLSFHIWRK
jgi:hypothetical protein